MVISLRERGVCQVHLNMSLIPVGLSNPGWRVIWSKQKESGNAICNLGVDHTRVQHQSGFVSLHLFGSCLSEGQWTAWFFLLRFPPTIHSPSRCALTLAALDWPSRQPGLGGAGVGGMTPCFLRGCVNQCDRLRSCLPVCLTPFFPKPSSSVFILVSDLLDTQLKCPYNSANCHRVYLMNKIIHGQNPLHIYLFFLKEGWGGTGERK